MVAIARAVQIEARVVVMDEPTSSLEQREVETLFGVVDRLRSAGIGIVYVSPAWTSSTDLRPGHRHADGRVVHVSDMPGWTGSI